MTITDVIIRLEQANEPSRELDLAIAQALVPDVVVLRHNDDTGENEPYVHWEYTGSVDAAIALAERVLPGWTWRVASCCVSDDAWIMPDFNHPTLGAGLIRDLPMVYAEQDPLEFLGTDIDLRPSGRPAIALCLAVLTAVHRVATLKANESETP